MPKVKSKSRDHFDKVDGAEAKVKCKICSKILSNTGGGTSNMISHLNRFHPQALCTNNTKESNIALTSQETSCTVIQTKLAFKKVKTINSTNIDEKLALMIAMDYQPFSVLENKGFKNFMEALCSDYKIPDKRRIRYEIMPQLYKTACAKLKVLFKDTEYLSLTSDLWSSRNSESFLTVTAHFFYNGCIQSCALNTIAMPELHTAENLAQQIRDITTEWDIKDKIVCVVTDNATNMTKMCQLLAMRHMPCFAHTLNLVVQDSISSKFKEFEDLMKKCKSIVKFVRKSSVATQALKKEQEGRYPGKRPLKLIQEVPTRWNSCYHMLQRFLELSDSLAVVLRKLPQAPDVITVEEENILKDAVDLLNVFDQATNMLSSDSYPT